MKLLCWNVNGVRAAAQKGFWDWFRARDADVVCLQETKASPDQLPPEERDPEGYWSAWQCPVKKKGYSGVACLSRKPPLAVVRELPDPAYAEEGRCLRLEFDAFFLLNIYFPNGQKDETRLAYKLGYYDAFLAHVEDLKRRKPVIVCGDFNTAHTEIDIARPKENENTSGFLPVERAWMDRFAAHGWVDAFRAAHPGLRDQYTWWSFRARARERNVGWRIDYFFVSQDLAPRVRRAWIEPEVMGSDHCPIGLEIDC